MDGEAKLYTSDPFNLLGIGGKSFKGLRSRVNIKSIIELIVLIALHRVQSALQRG